MIICLCLSNFTLSHNKSLSLKIYFFSFCVKDPFVANWWLEYGSGNVVGYWPSRLFNELKGEAYFAQFGGEVRN